MRVILTRTGLIVLAFVVAIGFASSMTNQDVSAATSMYGRSEWQGYFTGGYTNDQAYGCGDGSGRLMCDGIHVGDTGALVGYYWGRLHGSDTQHSRAAAFTILAMLGVDGPSTGGIANGVQMAKDRFSEWDARVRSYGAAGRINFSYNFTFSTNTAYRQGDILWRNDTDTAESIVFTLQDGSHVAIKKSCANLVGAAYLPSVDYNLSASSSVNRSTVTPGQRITWSHELRNNGSGATTGNTYSYLGMSGFSDPDWRTGANRQTTPAGAGIGPIRSWSYNIYDARPDDVGKTLCQWVEFDPVNSAGARDGRSTPACVSVPYDYRLTPTITNITDGDMIESNAGNIPIQGRITNSGATKSHPDIDWQVTQIRYRPTATIVRASGGVSADPACAYFGTPGASCDRLEYGREAGGFDRGESKWYTATGNLGDVEVGTRLCYAMSVRRGSSTNPDWRHSQLYCLVVGKLPKVQVYGGDLIVGRGYNSAGAKISKGVITSSSDKGGTFYGSWSEYAIIPSGQILGMASASGYAGGTSTKSLCNTSNPLNLLSFSNAQKTGSAPATCNNNSVGYYSLTSASQYDGIASRFSRPAGATILTNDVYVSDLESGKIYGGSGTINLSLSPGTTNTPMPAGKWVVINAPNANIRITRDLKYTDGDITSVRNIPQLVIIARNIVIADTVGRVDAWLLARGDGTSNGVVNTCDAVGVTEPAGLNSDVCSTQLTVNGPVIADRLLLYRTHGSGVGADSGTPAEVFNLRPDAYMWASNIAGAGAKARTATTTELPPRF